MNSVIGMGSALVDIIIRMKDDRLLEQFNLARGSMTLIDELMVERLLAAAGDIPKEMASGGSVANTIHGLATLGISTGYIGKIGMDSYGHHFEKDMAEQKVQFRKLYGTRPTGTAITLLSPDGERTFGTYLGAAVEMNPIELHQSLFNGFGWFMVEGYLVHNHDLISRAVKLARNEGLKIAMDMASFNVVEQNLDFLNDLVKNYVDLLFANEAEAYTFTGLKDPLECLDKMSSLCEYSVLKVGKEGSWIKHKNKIYRAESIQADCIDTTGAGDLYAAGFLYGLLNNHSLEKCGKLGSLLGGNVIEVIGTKMPEERWTKIMEKIHKI